MGIVSRLKEHMELMSRMMARADIAGGRDGGLAVEAQLRQAVYRCAACRDVDACRQWLDEVVECDRLPSFCRNAKLFAELGAK